MTSFPPWGKQEEGNSLLKATDCVNVSTLIVCKVCISAAIHGLGRNWGTDKLALPSPQNPQVKRGQVMVPECFSTLDHLADMNISSENKRFWEGNKKQGRGEMFRYVTRQLIFSEMK